MCKLSEQAKIVANFGIYAKMSTFLRQILQFWADIHQNYQKIANNAKIMAFMPFLSNYERYQLIFSENDLILP